MVNVITTEFSEGNLSSTPFLPLSFPCISFHTSKKKKEKEKALVITIPFLCVFVGEKQTSLGKSGPARLSKSRISNR